MFLSLYITPYWYLSNIIIITIGNKNIMQNPRVAVSAVRPGDDLAKNVSDANT